MLAQAGLRVGDGLNVADLDRLREAEARHDSLASALRLLSYRSRSEAELRERLARRDTPPAIIDDTIARLRELGLVDDEAFARAWVERRQHSSPRSRRLLALELRQKGVPHSTAQQALDTLDDEDAAYRAAARRARALAHLPYAEFRQKLGRFLIRRGFDQETTQAVMARLWRNRAEAQEGAESN